VIARLHRPALRWILFAFVACGHGAAARAQDDASSAKAAPAATPPASPAREAAPPGQGAAPLVRVGSKSFTESVVLGEIARLLAEDAGARAAHIRGLGGTRLVWEALLAGQIDAYAEYTGTLRQEILAAANLRTEEDTRAALRARGLRMSQPLGFNNTYAIGMKEARAAELGVRTISELRAHPELTLRFSNEFMQRGDGWPALAARYQLPQQDVRGLEHALAYAAIDQGAIDATDLYATDAKIQSLSLRVLDDDLRHFPAYHAVFVYREDLAQRAPEVVDALLSLQGRLSEERMIALNARVELEGASETRAAAEFLTDDLHIDADVRERPWTQDLWRYTREHLHMVLVSLTAATLVAIPLGVVAAQRPALAQPILGVAGVIQTIPSIALLVLLIRPISYVSGDLGYPQAVVALFLYSLLPIVRNTHAGLLGIPPQLNEAAVAIGLPRWTRLWRIQLPLASRSILAGIKTAAVINVGFATLGGFIGAGGYGDPIFTGIRKNDYGVILMGAVPAAALALVAQGLFELLERVVVPRGLRIKSAE